MAVRRHLVVPRLAGLVGTALALALVFQQPDLVNIARDRVFDQFQRIAPRARESDPVKVVEIDDAALARYGQWPWPRHRFATLVDRLDEAGAAAVVFDVIFAEPDRTSPANVASNWLEDPSLDGVAGELDAVDLGAVDHDRLLARALARAPSVLHLTSGVAASDAVCPPPLDASRIQGMTAADLSRVAASFRQIVAPLDEFRAAAKGEGFARAGLGDDAIIRSVPLIALACDGKEVYPSLAIEAIRVAAPRLDSAFAPADFVAAAADGPCRTHVTGVAGETVASVHLCGLRLPTTEEGELWIHYSRADNVAKRRLSVIDVLEGDAAALSEAVKGRIVMIGASAEGLRDVLVTPLGDERPGVHVHAEVIEQALAEETIFRAWDLMRPVEIGAAVFVCLILLLFLPRLSAAFGFGASIVLIGALFGGSFYAFQSQRLLIDPVSPGLVVLATFVSAFVVMFQQEQIARRFIRGAFGKFLSPLIIDRLERDPELLNLEGEEREITAFFSDIRGFTSISERLSPQQVSMLLNQYFTPMTRIVTDHKGLVDKYVGDALVAMWNAPIDIEEHPAQACRASLAMVRAMERLNAGWQADKSLPIPEVRIGIGLHTDVARVGNFGSEDHLQYSMLGDMVNLTSRLESLTKEYRVPIIISSHTFDRIPDFAAVALGAITVKGRSDATVIFALVGDETVGASPAFKRFKSAFEAGVVALHDGQFDAARDRFRDAKTGETFGLANAIARFEEQAAAGAAA